jgi:hypothetical protein
LRLLLVRVGLSLVFSLFKDIQILDKKSPDLNRDFLLFKKTNLVFCQFSFCYFTIRL